MNIIDLAHQAAPEKKKALQTLYTLIVNENRDPKATLEAALWLLENGNDYRVPYSAFVRLFNAGYSRGEMMNLMIRAFYEPNLKAIEKRYRGNCKALKKYPYLFRKDFIPFDELPIIFFPYDDDGYVPFDSREERFLEYVNPKFSVVSRNFFKNLEKPILAENVFSQYELEYLRDNVRPSEFVGRENHVYLSYPDWALFCSWLQVLDVRPLLKEEKFVFLIGEERELYPIDFAARFHIDYSRCPLRPVGIREVNKLIWHTQLSSHNGGDFFNEVFDSHPNLLVIPSLLFDDVTEQIAMLRGFLSDKENYIPERMIGSGFDALRQLRELRNPTDKDLLVALFLAERDWVQSADPAARIAPALFFQPHFKHLMPSMDVFSKENAIALHSGNMDKIHAFRPFQEFRYIKTFSPLRRFTNSYAATVRYMKTQLLADKDGSAGVFPDVVTQRVLERQFLRDPQDRLFRDSVVVRFEDAKFNPEATFTRLAAFLDLPYTDSLTYCSEKGLKNPVTPGNAVGFDTTTVNWTWPRFANNHERAFIEYFLRDAYAFYGYSLDYYDGTPVDEARVAAWIEDFDVINDFTRESWQLTMERKRLTPDGKVLPKESVFDEQVVFARNQMIDERIRELQEQRLQCASILFRNPRFVNRRGRPLEMIPLLKPDPNLLKRPLYWDSLPESGETALGQKGTLYFFTGLSGAGKSTIGGLFFQRMQERGKEIVLIDGDRRRERFGATSSRDFSFAARLTGARSMFRRCKELTDAGKDVVCCSISMFHEIRVWNRLHIKHYREIYLKASMETLYKRDQRGLYSSGAPNVVGVNIPWEEPSRADIVIENDGQETPPEIVDRIEKAFGII